MKRLIGVLLLLWPAVAVAEPPRNVVLADLGLHVIGVGYQRTVAPRLAAQLDVDYYSPWTQLRADGRSIQDVVGAVVRARVFGFLHAPPTGWWASPFVQAGRAGGGTVWAVGASVGHAWLFGKIGLSVGLGVQYHAAEPTFAGVWPHADLNVGYAF